MRCPSCEHDNRAERRFCAECGAALAAPCASCGASNVPGEKFCGGCGAALGVSPPPTATTAPASYTPKHLADKILTSRAALEGERKQVTVLFADVQGSMQLAEQMDPEEWRAIMQRFFQILSEGVDRPRGPRATRLLYGAPAARCACRLCPRGEAPTRVGVLGADGSPLR
jgi:Double zinc ribbon